MVRFNSIVYSQEFQNHLGVKNIKTEKHKNFLGAVAVGSKMGLMVLGAMCAIAVTVWAVAASMLEVTASMHNVQVTSGLMHPLCGLLQAPCGLLHPLCMMYKRYVGCRILYVGYYTLYA